MFENDGRRNVLSSQWKDNNIGSVLPQRVRQNCGVAAKKVLSLTDRRQHQTVTARLITGRPSTLEKRTSDPRYRGDGALLYVVYTYVKLVRPLWKAVVDVPCNL